MYVCVVLAFSLQGSLFLQLTLQAHRRQSKVAFSLHGTNDFSSVLTYGIKNNHSFTCCLVALLPLYYPEHFNYPQKNWLLVMKYLQYVGCKKLLHQSQQRNILFAAMLYVYNNVVDII